MMTSFSGYPVWQATYLPLGDEFNPQMTVNNYQFTGLERDAESDLDHTWFRQYSSTVDRWMTPDPLGGDITNPQSLNRYAYVMNNPTTLTDPLGLFGNCTYGGTYPDCNPPPETGSCLPDINPFCPQPCSAMVWAPGCGGGGGGGGGTPPPKPPPTKQGIAQRLNCASQFGNNHSLAAAFGAQNNFLANLFLGNTVSGLTNLGLFISGSATPASANLASIALKGAAQGIPMPPGNPGLSGATGQVRSIGVQVAVSAGYNALAGAGAEPIELGLGAAGTIATPVAQLGSETLSNVAFGVGVAKFAFDFSTFAYGYLFACQ